MDEQILIISSDSRVLDVVRRGLIGAGYGVAVVYEGDAGLNLARQRAHEAVILDLGLAGFDGLEACRRLRAEGNVVPILVLTVRDLVSDRVACLDAGADDALSPPFAAEELLARFRALVRRQKGSFEGQSLRLSDLVLNPASREVRRGGRLLNLTMREYDLLELFARHPRQVLTREIIYDHVWGYDFAGESNIIEVYVRNLRAKLEARSAPRLLHTVRGVGYVLREE